MNVGLGMDSNSPSASFESSRPRRPRYPGEDTRLTSPRELWGWYSYGLAAEVFAVCGVGSFLPVTIELLARERGFLRSDGTTPCIQRASPSPASSSASDGRSLVVDAGHLLLRSLMQLHERVATDEGQKKVNGEGDQCVVSPFGLKMSTSSFALYTSSLAVLVQVQVLISLSAVADYGDNRKRMLLGLGFTGATACMLFIAVFPGIYLVAPLLTVISVTCMGSSFVLLNSFLPLLVSNHADIHHPKNIHSEDSASNSHLPNSTSSDIPLTEMPADLAREDPLNDNDYDYVEDDWSESTSRLRQGRKGAASSNNTSPSLKLSNQISSRGVGIGYSAAVFMQIMSIMTLVACSKLFPSTSGTTLPLRLALFIVGLWWCVFILPAARWLRPRPGPPLPAHVSAGHTRRSVWMAYLVFAWKSLWNTIKVAVRLRQVVIFLLAWFLLSDAIATVSGTAILFARTELHMATTSVAVISVLATSSGIAGALLWPMIARRFQWQTNHLIIACILLFETIPLYGLLAFIPFVKAWGVGGMQKPWEIFIMAVIHGFVMGGISSYCRSFYGLLIPPGSEAAFYALYAVTDKGSSIIGPTIVGRITDATGSIRPAFWFLAVLVLLPAPLVWYVDVDQGREDALRMARLLGTMAKWDGEMEDGMGERDGAGGDGDQQHEQHEQLLGRNA